MYYESAAIREVEREMSAFLDGSQMKRLHECLFRVMGVEDLESPDNMALLQDSLNAKTVEGCSPRTIQSHKFRRTMATRVIDKGMPIEQVQVLLGHSKIDTTLCYAMVDQQNVKRSYSKYIG